MLEQTCKTKGDYLLKQYSDIDTAYKSIMNQYSEFKPSIKSCLKDPKNYVNELMRFSQNSDLVKDKVSYLWYQKFLKYMVKCTTKGMNLASSFMNKVSSTLLSEAEQKKNTKGKTNSLLSISKKRALTGISAIGSVGSKAYDKLFLSIPASIVLIGIGLWLSATGKIVKKLRSKPGLIEKLKRKFDKYFGNEEDDIPDDLAPPDIEVPNVSINLSESIVSHMTDRVKITASEIIIKVLFLLFLKAVLSIYMYESVATTITMLVAIFVPGLNLITFLLLWITIGICSLVKLFRKPKVTLSYEGEPNA